MRHADTVVVQRAYLARINVHAVRGQHLSVEQILFFHPRDDGHIVFAAALLNLALGLGQMYMQGYVVFRCKRGAGLEHIARAGIRGVRSDRRQDERVSLPAFNEVARRGQSVLKTGRVRSREFQHRL